MLIDGEYLDHLYVRPEAQRCGVGSALLHKARSLSPRRLALVTFQRNSSARAFYEKHGFRPSRFTTGRTRRASPTCTICGRRRHDTIHLSNE
jgi:GNAT superfamily N-acetyltransferase